jgi:hypothetical protein
MSVISAVRFAACGHNGIAARLPLCSLWVVCRR